MAAFTLGLVALFGLYGLAIKQADREWYAWAGLIFAATLFFSYPTMAIDLFAYAIRAQGWGLYGLNPLAISPAAFPPAYPWSGLAAEWADAASPYGPLWEVLALGAFKLSGGSFLAHLFWLKAMVLVGYVASIWLVGDILAQVNPGWRVGGMIAFAWNPLVLLEAAQNAHNDMLMVALLLASVWALVKNKPWGVIPLLALAAQIKIIAVLVAPFWLIALAARGSTPVRRVIILFTQSFLLAVLIIWPMLPWWPGFENWAVLQANRGAGRSVVALLVLAFEKLLGVDAAFSLARGVVNVLFAGAMGRLVWQTRRRWGQVQTVLYWGWGVFFWYVLLVMPVFHSWYLLWFFPLAILVFPHQRVLQASLIFCFTGLVVIPYFETIRVWYPWLLHNQLAGHSIGVPLLVFPPMVGLVYPSQWLNNLLTLSDNGGIIKDKDLTGS